MTESTPNSTKAILNDLQSNDNRRRISAIRTILDHHLIDVEYEAPLRRAAQEGGSLFDGTSGLGELAQKALQLYDQRIEQRIQEELEASKLRQEAERAARRALIAARIQSGERVFLYRSVYVPVDSVLVEEALARGFDISTIAELGLQGWEVTGIVPRTIGTGLKNSSIGSSIGTTWGAGVGGNVLGVYMVLKKEITSHDIDSLDDEVLD